MSEKSYSKKELQEFLDDFQIKSISEKYDTLVKITSSYYALEINGIHIEKLILNEDTLGIVTPNNRRIELRIVDDLEIRFLNENMKGD